MFDLTLENMVQRELVNRGVTSQPVMEAFRRIPRAVFVPDYLQHQALADAALPIGLGQTLSPPHTIARMMQELNLKPKSRVLEIGTGSGFQAALLSTIAKHVYSVELLPELSARARRLLVDDMGITNLSLHVADGHQGWSDEAPFDAIIVNGAVEEIPDALIGQLRDKGRLVIPTGENGSVLQVVTRVGYSETFEEVPAELYGGTFRPLDGGDNEDD